jgi:hypothetical protein
MRAPKERFDLVHGFLARVFSGDLHAKRILSLANGALGVMTGIAEASWGILCGMHCSIRLLYWRD